MEATRRKMPEPADSLGLMKLALKAKKILGSMRKEIRRRANRNAMWDI